MDDYARLELNASLKGWTCSECGLFTDSVGRPVFEDMPWVVEPKTNSWLENKPKYKYCPGCGRPIGGDFAWQKR